MAQPIWITPVGSLGTIPEGVFFSAPLQAFDPAAGTVYFVVVSGQLPSGITVSSSGAVEGVPYAVATIEGVPTNIPTDITSKFCIRAYTTKVIDGVTVVDRFADRTFAITVAGQNIPTFITPAGSLGSTDDAGYAAFQILFTDNDENDTIIVSVVSGNLPDGTVINQSGLISGFIPPILDSTEIYTFSIGLTDGKSSNLREFSITVTRNSIIKPYISNFLPSDIGTYRSANYFAFKFDGQDFEDQPIEYFEYIDTGLEFPPGLTLDPDTGWLFGSIPDLGLTELTYNFAVQVQRSGDPSTLSDPYYFSMNLIGSIDNQIVWVTDSNLGSINTGDTSILRVEAVSAAGLTINYKFKENDYPTVNIGVYNKLPQGLKLLPSGHIAGRVSFNTFTLDSGSTTFDVNSRDRRVLNPTTFDLTYRFTVNAYSDNGVINVFKDFVIKVNRAYNEPYENLYIQAMPSLVDKSVIDTILNDSSVFVPNLIYRSDDPNFGLAQNIVYYHTYGLTASTVDQYLAAMNINHYWKNLLLGPVVTARALDSNGLVVYEVVYSQIIDNLVNTAGQSVSKQVTLPYPLVDDTLTVYPNSLINMRDQIVDEIGQISNSLPLWMTSKQENGSVLGFVPAWVLCYAKPGEGKKIAYYFNNTYSDTLNRIDFTADRYELDRLLSKNWNPIADSTQGAWEPTPAATTFDLENHYELTTVVDAGSGYEINDEILVDGTVFGGQSGLNNLVIRVLDVGIGGAITQVVLTGTAPLLSGGDTYTNITGTTAGSGINAEFDLISGSGDVTVFDGDSLQFEVPVDIYSNTDEYNKYLIFPQRNILV